MFRLLLPLPLTIVLAFFSVGGHAGVPFAGGDPIDVENAADIQEMIRIADAVDAAVDAKAWDEARGYFTDQIDVDFTSLTGGDPATIPADTLIAGWSANLKPSKTSFHLRGNHRVTFEGSDRATMLSHGYAWNRMETGARPENGGDPLWEVWGVYTHSFTRTKDGWRVSGMIFQMTAERGNLYVRDTIPEE